MDSETEDLLLQKLQEFIIDEDRIITVISASELLNVSVQDANKLLQTFAGDQKVVQKSVTATYIVSGVLKDGNLGVRLLKQDELVEKKHMFKTVSNEVLYSLQKCNSIDLNSVVSANGFDTAAVRENPLLGSITGKNCVKRTVKVKPTPKPETKPVIKGKSSFFTKSASTSNIDKNETTESSKSENKSDSKEKPSFFSKANSTENADSKKKAESKQITKHKSNGGIASFFNKMPSKPVLIVKDTQNNSLSVSENNISSRTTPPPDKEDCTEETMVVDDHESSSVQEQHEVTKTPERKSGKNKRQRSTTKKSDKPSKRRKRIKEIKSDSDSDDMFADNDLEKSEDIIGNSDEEQPVAKSKIEAPPPPVKNKKRKLVDKTFEDEEGFIITSKEWVYESASSEDEKEQRDPVVSQKAKQATIPAAQTKKEISPPVSNNNKGKKGKKNGSTGQPTLMSFFKKS